MLDLSMRLLTALCLGLLLSPAAAAQDDDYAEDVAAAERAIARGDLRKAESILDEILADAAADPAAMSPASLRSARLGMLTIRFRSGDDEAIERGLSELSAADRAQPDFTALAIDSRLRRGRYAEAETALREALARDGEQPRWLTRLGRLLDEVGRAAEAQEFLARSAETRATDPIEKSWSAFAAMTLGGRERVESASQQLVQAIREAPDEWLPRTLYGLLRFSVYGEWAGAASGESALLEVLERNGEIEMALLGLYRLRSQNHLLDPAKTESFLDRALALNHRSAEALRLRGIAWLDDRNYAEGARVLDSALAIHPNDRETLAQRAAAALILDDQAGYRRFRERSETFGEGWAGIDRAIGERLVAIYRFGDALPWFEAALAKQPDDLPTLHGYAKALVHAGRGEEARKLLERAKEIQRGYVNPWRNNALAVQSLLEEEYVMHEEGGMRFWLHRDDAEVLRRYLVPFAVDAKAKLDAKYGIQPPVDVRFESFHTWDDFSVRTTGFRGFPALGACFGPMITFVSPVDGDLRKNDFMWQATVWHEYVHVLTLQLSRHRVPRWLTEGFSVYEERQRDRSWERGMERELIDAVHNDEIAPIRSFDRVFRGPRILFGYYQGGLLVEFLAERFGFDKVLELLRAYGDDLAPDAAFRRAFAVPSETIDRDFLEWIRDQRIARIALRPRSSDRTIERLRARVARDPDDLDAHLALAFAALERGVDVDATTALREVLRRDPENGPAKFAEAEVLRRRGRSDEAIERYRAAFAAGAEDFDARIRCATLLEESGDVEGAMQQYLAAKKAWPTCTEQATSPELRLARIHREAGRTVEAMMELATFCSRTARAYAPRLELAAFARAAGDARQEVELLEQAIAIDPFHREVHDRLATAYESTGRADRAVTELEAMLAIPPELDRGNLGKPPAEVAGVDSPEFRAEQAQIALRLGKLLLGLDRRAAAKAALERVLRDEPEGSAANAARDLLSELDAKR
jgi:tetratricopeptide (TPR) repeat protein